MLNKWKRQGLRGRVYAKRARSFDGGFSKGKLEIQDKPKFKKRVSNQVPSYFHKSREDRVTNSKFNKERDTS